MNQLFVTLRAAEAAAEAALPLVRKALELHSSPVRCRRFLVDAQIKLHRACELYERSDFVEDDDGPYVKLFDALSFVTQASRSYAISRVCVQRAITLLEQIAR